MPRVACRKGRGQDVSLLVACCAGALARCAGWFRRLLVGFCLLRVAPGGMARCAGHQDFITG
ncbi:hypothetical protein A2U01_0071353, partial [Trifolium medium]|nr:hypothetical protein [Trifolium medium]